MKRFIYNLLPMVILFALSSCAMVHEELPSCRALKVVVAVKDKNYSNVNKIDIATPVREDLPFREYVSTLCWRLVHVETGKVVAEHKACAVEVDDREVTLDFGDKLPFGEYELTIWGNLSSHEPLAEDHSNLTFHPANDMGDDVYMTRDLISYGLGDTAPHRVELERTKGKLLIEKVNLPSDLTTSSKRISGVYASVDKHFNYDGETFVSSETPLPGESRVLTETVLSPSVGKDRSVVSVSFSDETRATEFYPDPDDVSITMNRNELTVLRYVWDENLRKFKIFVYINAGWSEYYKLELE